jgi:hypothetical protein
LRKEDKDVKKLRQLSLKRGEDVPSNSPLSSAFQGIMITPLPECNFIPDLRSSLEESTALTNHIRAIAGAVEDHNVNNDIGDLALPL